MIAAAEVNEREAFAVLGVEDFGDQDGVIAGIDQFMNGAFERGQDAGNEGHAMTSRDPVDAFEAVLAAA